MRPRLITAENAPHSRSSIARVIGFNEAAAHHRGEHGHAGRSSEAQGASMRPRLITAENLVAEWKNPNYIKLQ